MWHVFKFVYLLTYLLTYSLTYSSVKTNLGSWAHTHTHTHPHKTNLIDERLWFIVLASVAKHEDKVGHHVVDTLVLQRRHPL